MASMAALLHINRLRHALLSSAREAVEAVSKALRADNSSMASQAVASFLDGPHAPPAAEASSRSSTATPAAQNPSQVSLLATDPPAPSHTEQNKVVSPTPSCNEASFEGAAVPATSLAEPRSSEASSRECDSRLDESEGWFLTDMISGCEEGSLHARRLRRGTNESAGSSVSSRSSCSRGQGSIVMVSSVESLLSVDRDVDDMDGLSSGGSSKGEEDSRSGPKPRVSVSAMYSAGEASVGEDAKTAADLEQQIEQDTVPLLWGLKRQGDDEAIDVINRKRFCDGERFYMIEAGRGWSSYQSLDDLLSFLRETVKVFGADRLRRTKFLLPVQEAEVFLGELEKIAPYSIEDFVSAARAAASPFFLALAARFFFIQLTEAAVTWTAAAELSAATAATATAGGAAATAAGETAAAAASAASIPSVCSTAFAVMPWVILVGGVGYGVFCAVCTLRNARKKVILLPTAEAEETKLEEGMPRDTFRDHCIVIWGQAAGE